MLHDTLIFAILGCDFVAHSFIPAYQYWGLEKELQFEDFDVRIYVDTFV